MAAAGFLGAFVIFEPAPYELFVCVLMVLFFLGGLTVTRHSMPLLLLTSLYSLGGMITLFQLTSPSSQVVYVAVTFFLGLTSWFFALVVQQDVFRLKVIINGYVIGAVLTAALGSIAYLGLLPGGDMFLRFGRARGAFQDPNVFAPFLVLPAAWLWHGILTKPSNLILLRAAGLSILLVGILLAFSRAGWGLVLFALGGVYLVAFMQARTLVKRVQLLALAGVGAVAMLGALLVALQFEQISSVFETRARVVQDYDGGALGRFERHALGFQLAFEKPFGIGRSEFAKLFTEDPHNIWLKSLMVYGWLGFVAYLVLTLWTLKCGFKTLFYSRPWTPYLQVLYVVFLGHIVMAYVIDIDHWRHMFLITCLLWGIYGLEASHQKQMQRN